MVPVLRICLAEKVLRSDMFDGWLTTSQNMVKIFLILSLVVDYDCACFLQ